MMRGRLILIILFFHFSADAQIIQQFRKLSCPEKRWVLFHPLVAKPAFVITKQVQQLVDSVKYTGIIGSDINGGKLDAFKHAFWMASLTHRMGSRKALKLGKAHEQANRLQFEKRELEESILPDSVSSEMDLRNNSVGALLVKKKEKISSAEIRKRVMQALAKGRLFIIRKDSEGRYLGCDGRPIDLPEWKGRWDIPKCIIRSAQE